MKFANGFFDRCDKLLNKNVIFAIWMVLIFAFSPPGYLTRFMFFHVLILICKFLACAYLLVSAIIGLKRVIDSGDRDLLVFLSLIVLLNLLLVISTVYNGESLYEAANYCIPLMLIGFSFVGLKKEYRLCALNAISTILICYACINALSIVIFPDGLYWPEDASGTEAYYFLGHNNSTIRFLFPGIICAGIYDFETLGKLSEKSILFIAISTLQITLTSSLTALIGIVILLLYFPLRKIERVWKYYHPGVFAVVPVLLLLLVVMCRIQNLFSFIVEGILGKSLTLTGRTDIWAAAVSGIMKHPFIGYGIGRDFYKITDLWFGASSAHNYLLDLAFRGGILCAIILQLVVCLFMYRLEEYDSPSRGWLSFAFLSYFVMWTVEPFMSTGVVGMYLLFTVTYIHNALSPRDCAKKGEDYG